MKKIHFLLCVLFAGLTVNGQSLLTKGYYFPLADIEVNKMSQRNDTLYEYKCYTNKPCIENPKRHYKVWGIVVQADKYIFKLERLDTIPLTSTPYPENRYAIFVLKQLDTNRISLMYQQYRLSKKDITSDFVDSFKVINKFGFTYFSKSYYEELSTWNKLSTKAQADEILLLLRTEKYKKLGKLYKKSHISDMYAAGFSAEILNLACIDKKLNPIGAGVLINKIMRASQKTGSL
jgi:hypothetical protein